MPIIQFVSPFAILIFFSNGTRKRGGTLAGPFSDHSILQLKDRRNLS